MGVLQLLCQGSEDGFARFEIGVFSNYLATVTVQKSCRFTLIQSPLLKRAEG